MKTYYTDMHCHILPHIDDGAATMEEAIAMLRLSGEQGVRTVLLTPHYRRGYFETSRDDVERQFERLRMCAAGEGIDIELYLGCELYRADGMQKILEADERYCINATRYVLLEFSPNDLGRYDLALHSRSVDQRVPPGDRACGTVPGSQGYEVCTKAGRCRSIYSGECRKHTRVERMGGEAPLQKASLQRTCTSCRKRRTWDAGESSVYRTLCGLFSEKDRIRDGAKTAGRESKSSTGRKRLLRKEIQEEKNGTKKDGTGHTAD